jgi:hypothetical protein
MDGGELHAASLTARPASPLPLRAANRAERAGRRNVAKQRRLGVEGVHPMHQLVWALGTNGRRLRDSARRTLTRYQQWTMSWWLLVT